MVLRKMRISAGIWISRAGIKAGTGCVDLTTYRLQFQAEIPLAKVAPGHADVIKPNPRLYSECARSYVRQLLI